MKHLWIIDGESSTTIFYRNYSHQKIDPDLVSGLLSALNNFSEVELKQTGIESVNMGGLKWVYLNERDYNMLFIAADEKNTNPNVMKSRLDVIRNTFLAEFELTPENWISRWNGEVIQFEQFKETVDMLNEQWKKAEKIMSTAELFDLLGIFQQVLNLYINIIKLNFFGESYEEVITKIQNIVHQIQDMEQFKSDPEIQKIDFDEERGWNVINVNPAQVDPDDLEKVLLFITRQIRKFIGEKMGKMLALHSLNQEIFPFLLSNWQLLKRLRLEKKLLSIFVGTKN